MTIRYFPHVQGTPPNDHRHGYESFLAASTTSSPSSLRYWPKLTEDTPENRAELARRIVEMFGEDFDRGPYTGDLRRTWAQRWLSEYLADVAVPGAVDHV